MSQEPFEATLHVQVSHINGPELPPSHVARWISADGHEPGGAPGGFRFGVCSGHEDPDDCGDDCEASGFNFDTLYEVKIHAVSLDEPK